MNESSIQPHHTSRKGTSAIISDSTVANLADSFMGLPDAHAIGKQLTPKSEAVPTSEEEEEDSFHDDIEDPGRLRLS